MTNVIFVGLGGFVGAVLRYLLGLIPVRQTPFPIITLCINVLGAFVIGLLAALCEKKNQFPAAAAVFEGGALRRVYHIFHLLVGDL